MTGLRASARPAALWLAGLFVLMTLLAWLSPLHALFELMANLRMQLLEGALLLLAVAAVAKWRDVAIAAGLVVLVQTFYLLPYWTAEADPITAAPTGEVMQYNIYFGNTNYDAIAEAINDSGADVVSIQELTDTQWAELGPRLTEYPHRVAVPVSDEIGELGGGMALLSRNPATEVTVDSPANSADRPILAVNTTVAGEPVMVIGLHPHASRFRSAKVELRDEQLDAVVDTAEAVGGPVIVMTDMNITPFSSTYKRFLDDTGWRDPHEVAGWKATWPWFAGPLGTPIDHIFISNDVGLHRYTTGDSNGSDHRSLTATVSILGAG